MKSPIEYTLWVECLCQCMKEAKERGEKELNFSDVDKRVIEMSQQIVEWKTKIDGENI